MFVNNPLLKDKLNGVAMNLMNTYIFSFTADGEFLEFRVDLDKKTIGEATVKNVS